MRAYQILQFFDIFKEQNKDFTFSNIAQELPKSVEVTYNRIDFDIEQLPKWKFAIFYHDNANSHYMKLFAAYSDEISPSEMELGILSEQFPAYELPKNEEQKRAYISHLLPFIKKKPYLAYAINSTGSYLFKENSFLYYLKNRYHIIKERKKNAIKKVKIFAQATSLKGKLVKLSNVSKVNLASNANSEEVNLDIYFSTPVSIPELIKLLYHPSGKPRYSLYHKIKIKVKDPDEGYKNIIFSEDDFISTFGFLRKLLKRKKYSVSAIRINFEN